MKRNIVFICLCVLLIAVLAIAVYCVPFEEEISLTFHGIQIEPDGTIIQECSFDLNAVKNYYLFREHDYKDIEVSVLGYTLNSDGRVNSTVDPVIMDEWPAEYIVFTTYIDPLPCPVSLFLDKEQNWCFIKFSLPSNDELHFIGTLDSELDPLDIWDEWNTLFT